MKLRSITVSNLRSFSENNNGSNKIDFSDTIPNILIGPNGSGKSNLIETINQIFTKVLFCEYTLNYDNSQNPQSIKQTIVKDNQSLQFLIPNWNVAIDRPSYVELVVLFEEVDIQNLKWIKSVADEIAELVPKYSVTDLSPLLNLVRNTSVETLTEFEKTMKVLFQYANNVISAKLEEKDAFVQYLEEYELINEVIKLRNSLADNSTEPWPQLQPSFLLEGVSRNYSMFNENYQMDATKAGKINQLTSTRKRRKEMNTIVANINEPAVFEYLRHKFSSIGEKAMQAKGVKKGVEAIQDAMKNDKLLKELNNLISISCIFDEFAWSTSYNFRFTKAGKEVSFSSLSSGERAITALVLSIGMFEINSGLIVVDEPELHLHPDLQKKYKSIVEKLSRERGLQVILATHSPAFVDETSIPGVIRLYKDSVGNTKFTRSSNTTIRAKDLIQYLSYTNASRVFFVDKLLLVEGPSDAYFFNAYMNQKHPKRTVAVLSIEGKGSQKRWRAFLDSWKIKNYFIGDNDCTTGYNIQNTVADIEGLYSDRIYILKRGNLESYLLAQGGNKVEEAINFCVNGFQFPDTNKKQELDDILKRIVR
jgi:putative ATP-dependent endonuclease of OLD family